MEDKTGLYIVSIVGVVALVAMVIMLTGNKGTEVISSGSEDSAGQMYANTLGDEGTVSCGSGGKIYCERTSTDEVFCATPSDCSKYHLEVLHPRAI